MKGFTIHLASLSDTDSLAHACSACLGPAHTLALSGPLGAGKSELARRIILALNPDQQDIPSPTFTLVQTYQADAGFDIWHCDLYRLAHTDEVWALGIEDALQNCLCLIEWPERIETVLPKQTIWVSLQHEPSSAEARRVRITSQKSSDQLRHLFTAVIDKGLTAEPVLDGSA